MTDTAHIARIRALFEQVREQPSTERHARLIYLGADPLIIAEVDAMLAGDAATSAWGHERPDSGAGTPAHTELGVGDSLDAWRLLREIGSGGMGAVYLAERADGHFDQQAAIKLIRGIPEAATFVHFARERQILATLQHPNIARLLDGGATPGGQPYLVMEYVEGVPIDAYCRDRALGLLARLRLFQQVCDTVQFAHRRFVVHCDLKPSNVLVRADGTPMLLDFGIARALDRAPSAREDLAANAWITPRYASPEQLRGDAVSTASDVFSLGLILFELLAGRRARLDAEDHTITLLGRAAVRPSELADSMPWRHRLRGDLDAIVQRATANDPAQRYESATALAGDIQRHLDLRPVLARQADMGYRMLRLLRRRWPAFAGATAAAVLAAVFTWRLAAERDRAVLAEREASIQAATAERVSDFLVSVFEVSNPKNNQQRTISARDVLDQGATRIEGELVDTPRVKAKLLAVLGTAYRYIGEPARAVELLRTSSELYLSPQVDQPLDAAATLSQLAVVYNNNKYPASEAQRVAREVLRLRERYAEPNSLDMADAYNTLGLVLENDDQFDEAEPLLRKALAIRTRLLGPDSLSVGTTLNNLALVMAGRGDHDSALQLFETSLAIKLKAVGERHPDYQHSLKNYAMELGANGRRAEALAALQRNLELAVDLYGERSDEVSAAENEIGSMLHDLGRFNEAATHYRAAMAIEAVTQGPGSGSYALPLNNLASVYEDMGDFAAAETLFLESLALRRKTQDIGSAMIVRGEYNLARLLVRSGQLAQARPLLDAVLVAYRGKHGEANLNTLRAELLDVEWLLQSSRVEQAQTAYTRVLSSPATLDAQWPARRALIGARIALRRNDALAAVEAGKAAWDAIRAFWGERHPLVAEYALVYASALAQAGRADEARTLVESMRGVISETFSAQAPVRAQLAKWP